MWRSNVGEPLTKVASDLIERMREPLGLDRWTIKVVFAPGDNPAECAAMPEYRAASIHIDPDKLETGDELDEFIAHELGHCGLWPLASVADDMAIAVAEMAPDYMREALGKLVKETVRKAEEDTATTVGQNYVRLLRRLWKAETDLAQAKKEARALRQAAKDA